MSVAAETREEPEEPAVSRPSLAVVHDVTSSSPLELVELLREHCDIVWVLDASDPRLGSWARLLPRFGTVMDVAGRDPVAVACDLRAIGVDGVVAFTDSQLLTAARLGEDLGLEGNTSEVVLALTDKLVQRSILEGAGIPGPRHVAVPADTSVEELGNLLGGLRFPVVLKPQCGTGSRDTARVPDLVGALAYLHEIEDDGGNRVDLIVEEWLEDAGAPGASPFASYVSVEAVACRGVIVPLAITGKFPLAPPCRETGNFLPHHLPPDEAEAVLVLAVRAAQALNVTSGALHIEIKMTPDGPRIIEVNGRIGGGGIDTLFASRHGRSLTEIAAAIAVGRPVDLEPVGQGGRNGPDDRDGGCEQKGAFDYAFFVQPPAQARVLTALDNLESLNELDGVEESRVNRTIGDTLHWRDGSQGYVLSVRGSVDGLVELGKVPERIGSALTIGWR